MERYLGEVTSLCKRHDVPLIVAGDVFHKWNSPAELINFAIKQLSGVLVYAVPGQHDLPFHRYEDVKRSAYWTLVESEAVQNLKPDMVTYVPQMSLALFPFPWGHPVKSLPKMLTKGFVHLAVIHSYIWDQESNSYKGASEEKKAHHYRDKLKGYDAAVFGDNHRGFQFHFKYAKFRPIDGDRSVHSGSHFCHVMNCGTFIRRRSDEINYKPRVGILHRDGTIEAHHLNTSEDRFLDDKEIGKIAVTGLLKAGEFIRDLSNLEGEGGLDFADRLLRWMDDEKVRAEVRAEILLAMEGV
jgi:hypothetical protein